MFRRKTFRKRGGGYKGQGTYGCGFSPPLKCRGEAARRAGKFTKLMLESEARDELRTRNMFSPVNATQRYFLYPEDMCDPAAPEPANEVEKCTLIPGVIPSFDRGKIIVSTDGGTMLSKLRLPAGDYYNFFRSLTNLFDGLVAAHAANLTHNDIKPENIVSMKNPAGSYVTRFIDLGLAVDTRRLRERSLIRGDPMYHYEIFYNNYAYWPYDFRFTETIRGDEAFDHTDQGSINDFYDEIVEKYEFIPLGLYYRRDGSKLLTPRFAEQIVNSLAPMAISERARAILTGADVYALGVTLTRIYIQFIGHRDDGYGGPDIVMRGFEDDNRMVRPAEVDKEEYNSDARIWHAAVATNISAPFFRLTRRMMDIDYRLRISVRSALMSFTQLLAQMETYFTESNISRYIKPWAVKSAPILPPVAAATAAAAPPSMAVVRVGHGARASMAAAQETAPTLPGPGRARRSRTRKNRRH